MLVISTNLSQLSDLNWVMRVNTLFLCLTASSGSDQSGANQVKIRIKLSVRTGNDYYAWKILITGGRTCPDECFRWLDDNWCSVQFCLYNRRLLIFPPHILALWIEIFVRGMLEFTSYNKLIYKLLRSLTEFYELVTAIWFVETLCCHLTHITSTSDAENMKLPKQEYAPWHPGSVAPFKGLCCENLRITRTAAIGRSWHFVSFITFLGVRS